MGESLVYRSPRVYEALMIGLYGRHYGARYRAVADLIPEGSSVLELACGPGFLYERHLRPKRVAYHGLDLNPRFVARVKALGGTAEVWDLADDRPLPEADTVLMQASLYQFLPDAAPVVRRMLAAARERVIIAEPVRNLSDSRIPWVAAFARRQADPGKGDCPSRFNAATLDAFLRGLGAKVLQAFPIPGGREIVYVLDPKGA